MTVTTARTVTTVTTLTLARAINEGLRKAMEENPKVLIMGEDVGKLGGVFRVTDGLQKDFGESRVIDTPLAESGIIGTAVGLALRGYRPVCEIQFDGFVFRRWTRSSPSWRRCGCARWARSSCRSWCASPAAAASARWSTTASPRRCTSPTRRVCGWWRAPTPPTPTR